MQLSPHFTLAELTRSQTAARHGLDNRPGKAEVENLRRVCSDVLEPVRAHFGVSFSPTSGYRSLALNRRIGSRDTSQHILGQAVDFEVPGQTNAGVARWIAGRVNFDQLILEFYEPGDPSSGWVHCSVRPSGNRRALLTINKSGVKPCLVF